MGVKIWVMNFHISVLICECRPSEPYDVPEMVSECHFTGIWYPRWFDSKECIFMQKKLPSFSMHLSCNFHCSYHFVFCCLCCFCLIRFNYRQPLLFRSTIAISHMSFCLHFFHPPGCLPRRQDDGQTDRGCNMAVLLGDCIRCVVLPFSWTKVLYVCMRPLESGETWNEKQLCRIRLESSGRNCCNPD